MAAHPQADELKLVSLVNAKLCHDLLGPISALHMVAESLEDEDPAMLATSRKVILDSAAKALHRLSFFRAAVGRGQDLGSNEARGLIDKVLAESKITLEWDDKLSSTAGETGPVLLKLAINLAYLAGHALIGGGSLAVRLDGSAAAARIGIQGSGPRVNLEEAGRQALLAGAKSDEAAIAGLDPRTAHPYYTGRIAAGLGLLVTLPDAAPGTVRIVAAHS